MAKMNVNDSTNEISYLSYDQVKSKGCTWMAFFRFNDETKHYICDGIKVKGRWLGKNKAFPTWEQANNFLLKNGYKVDYAVSPLDGKVLAVNMGVIGAYLRTEYPKLAKNLARKAGVPSLRFARFNRTGKGFVGWDPDRHRRVKEIIKINPTFGSDLIGDKGSNAIDFRSKTGCSFKVMNDTVVLEGVPEKIDQAVSELKMRIASLTPTPSLGVSTVSSSKPQLSGWAKIASTNTGSNTSTTPPQTVKVVVSSTGNTTSTSETSVKEPLKTEEVFSLPPNTKVSNLIGTGGSTIRALRVYTKCDIDVINGLEEDDTLSMVVSHPMEHQRKFCYETVIALLNYLDDPSTECPIPLYTFEVSCPSDKVGLVMGRNGMNIQELRQRTRCQIHFDDERNIFVVSSFNKKTAQQGFKTVHLDVVKTRESKKTSTNLESKPESASISATQNRFSGFED